MLPIHRDLLFIIGRIGVAGFFLISGYLAVTSLDRRNARQFLLNRFMRIYPVYWFLLLINFLLSNNVGFKEFVWNLTLFEEFVGYEAMIGSSWMLPIMVLFFLLLLILKNGRKANGLFYITCVGSIVIGILRYMTGKPFPTALCLLMCVGLMGYMQKQSNQLLNKELIRNLLLFEVNIVIASALSYGDKVYWYFIAYNLAFVVYFLFQKYNWAFRLFDKLGELGFTFFLGASIPIKLIALFYPTITDLNCWVFVLVKFVLAVAFSYVITTRGEKPLLAWGKRMEKNLT